MPCNVLRVEHPKGELNVHDSCLHRAYSLTIQYEWSIGCPGGGNTCERGGRNGRLKTDFELL